jgi:hypothetical protein
MEGDVLAAASPAGWPPPQHGPPPAEGGRRPKKYPRPASRNSLHLGISQRLSNVPIFIALPREQGCALFYSKAVPYLSCNDIRGGGYSHL